MNIPCTLLFLFLCPLFLLGQGDLINVNYNILDTVKARVLLEAADSLLEKYELDEALEKAEAAKEIYVSVLGAETEEVADCLYLKGKVYDLKRDIQMAEKVWRFALYIREKVLMKDHPDIAAAYHVLGLVYYKQGEYEKAADLYEKAIDLYEKAFKVGLLSPRKKNLSVAYSYNNLGLVYWKQSKYEKAIDMYEKALTILSAIYKGNHSSVAYSYNNIGIIFMEQGEYGKAVKFYEKALAIWLNVYGGNHPIVANTYNNLGNVYEEQGEYEKAIAFHGKALDIWLETFKENHPTVANSYNNLGVVYGSKGYYEKAIAFHEKSLKIYLSIYRENHPEIAISYNDLGNVYVGQGEYKKGIGFYKKALQALNFTDIDNLNHINYLLELITIFHNMGKTYHKQYLTTKNDTALSNAYHCFQQTVAVHNFRSKNIGSNRKTRMAKTALEINDLAIATNLLLYQTTDSIHYLHEAFNYSENTKAYQLFEAIQESDALSFSGIPDNLLEQEYDIRTKITFHEKQRQEKFEEGLSQTDTIVLEISSKLFDLRQDYENLKATFEKEYPDYYRLKYDLSTVDVTEVQQDLIDSTQTLLEYFVGDSSIYIYVINKEDFYFHEIKKDFPLEEWVTNFREANAAGAYKNRTLQYCQSAHDLYQKLIAPVAKHLKEKLIIVPDGILGYLPFEALLVEYPKDLLYWKGYHYLLRDKQISYCYSATLLKEMQEKRYKEEATKGIVAFAPYYDGKKIATNESTRFIPSDSIKLNPLKFSGPEVFGIQEIAGADVYHHKKATEEQFRKSAGQYRIVHLATHGKANDEMGDYCYLAFTGQRDSVENEFVFVRDLYNLNLNAEMVVLSACETGVGELQKGEGIISLARGFTYAGTKSIITSLWSVDDESTKDLMVCFYQLLLNNGMTKDEALRQAKLDYLESLTLEEEERAHPYFWSGFIGIGDMKSIVF